jgi:DNA polymerase-1
LPVTLEHLQRPAHDREALSALYERLGFRRWREEITPSAADASTAAAPAPVVPPPPPLASVAETVLSWEGFEAMLRELEAAALVCLDTETDALDCHRAGLVGLAFAVTPGRGWYVPLAHRYVGAPEQLPMGEVLQRLRPLLEDPHKPKVGQHIKYDLHVLRRHGVSVQGVRFDTMLESFVLDAGLGRHDMDSLAEKHLQHRTIHFEDVAGRGRNQLTFDQVPVEPAAAYSAEDADVTLRLHEALYPRLQQIPSLQRLFDTLEMPLVPVLSRIEENGVRVDVPLLAKISAEFAQRMEALEAQAHAQAGHPFNIGSPSQLQKILFDELQLRAGARTAGGARSTAEDVLQELSAAHPLPQTVLDWRTISKLRSTYTETLAREVNPATGRIHTSYHQAGAATGRLSSSDPNLQNIPVRTAEGRRVRQAFIAAEGHALLSVDYSQIELRLMAHFSGDERLQAAFRADRDVHRATAAEVFGRGHDEVSSEERRAAKAINFGLIYGMSSFGLARQLGLPRAQAQQYIDAFFARYPGVKQFMEQTRLRAREQGYVETLFGRRLYLPEIASRNAAQRQYAERTAINAPLQGTAADLIKRAMIDLHVWLPEHAPEVRLILQVHDELVFEGPPERLLALAPTLCQRMCAVAELSVPLTAEAGVADNWEAARNSPLTGPAG